MAIGTGRDGVTLDVIRLGLVAQGVPTGTAAWTGHSDQQDFVDRCCLGTAALLNPIDTLAVGTGHEKDRGLCFEVNAEGQIESLLTGTMRTIERFEIDCRGMSQEHGQLAMGTGP